MTTEPKPELKVVSDNTPLVPASGTALAPAAAFDPLAAYADAVAPQYIIGEMLRFSKGFYYVGKKEEPLPIGTTFTVAPDELLAGWIKWFDSKPVEHEMVRVEDGVLPKQRGELGDTDPSQWPKDKDGKAKDMWQFTNYLPMMDEGGNLFTFTTASRGGISAIAQLLKRYANHRKRHPNVFPLIALNVDSYQHKDRNLGRIQIPVFEPSGYAPKTDFLAALAEAGHSGGVEPEAAEADPEDDFKDAIPF
jgi:hypothetical protein